MLTKDSKIAVVGAGAIGGVTAAFIHQLGWDIEIICKHQEIVDKIAAQGLSIRGIKGEQRVRLKAVKNISDLSEPKDLILLATKANDCISAARQLDAFLKPDSTVVSLQNGICEEALAGTLGRNRVVGCVVGWSATYLAPAELEVTSKGEFIIGNIDHQPDERLPAIQQLLNAVYPTRISNNIMGELFSKLIINSCINSLGVIAGVTLGELLANKKVRNIFLVLMREAMAVADAMKIKVEPAAGGKLDYYKYLSTSGAIADFKRHLVIRIIGFKYRRIKSSSLQSIERGRKTEINFLNGYICDRGKEYGVSTPINEAIRNMVLEIEDKKREMSLNNVKDPVFARI
ncbi:MAG: 2-dehydropantoate 2-reductase [Desulfobacterales bacterium]|jgi:2-dehydropantoate 2-reductase